MAASWDVSLAWSGTVILLISTVRRIASELGASFGRLRVSDGGPRSHSAGIDQVLRSWRQHIRARVSLPRGSGRRAARLRGAVGLRAPGRRTVVAPEGLGVGGVTVLAVRSGAPAARLPSYIPCKSINARSLTGAGVVELEISS